MLRFISCQAEIAESFCKALAAFIGRKVDISTEFIADIRQSLRREFLAMHTDQPGLQILESAGILRFLPVSDRNYDPIREMDRIAATVEW